MARFNGLGMNLGNLSRLSAAKTRSISPENFTGEKGEGGMAVQGTGAACARDLGQGWKISPSVKINAGETFVLADIAGPGAVQHMWMTPTGHWRFSILRLYWDDSDTPSVSTASTIPPLASTLSPVPSELTYISTSEICMEFASSAFPR